MALGQETMFIAIEAFIDAEPNLGTLHPRHILQRFGDFVNQLGTQPVTVTMSSLISDMLNSYATVPAELRQLSESASALELLAQQFIATRDCFSYSSGRTPAVEANFSVGHLSALCLDVGVRFSWFPPTLGFHDLSNLISEGTVYVLKPKISQNATSTLECVTEYCLENGDGWLSWEESEECYRGMVSPKVASRWGAERQDAFTLPLKLTAKITKFFPGNLRFETVLRCAIPLTVKRRADDCSSPYAGINALMGGPLLWRPRKSRNEPSPSPPTPNYGPEKQHEALNLKELHILMERKAESSRQRSPLRLNSLSLQMLHVAVALADPPTCLRDFQVRSLHGVQHLPPKSSSKSGSDKENEPARDQGKTHASSNHDSRKNAFDGRNREARKFKTPSGSTHLDTARLTFDLGATHISRYGTLASSSGSEDESPGIVSPPAHDITPPRCGFFSPSPRKFGRQNTLQRNPLHVSKADLDRSYPEVVAGPSTCSPKFSPKSKDGLCFPDSSRGPKQRVPGAECMHSEPRVDSTAGPRVSITTKKVNAPMSADEWQAAIQQNFNEFRSKKEEKLDVTMDDIADSDEELPSFQSDL